MQLRYFGNLIPPVDGMLKVSAITWAPNGKRLAVCTAERVVHIFDEQGSKKDKFPTKPSDKGQKTYVVRQIAFSPDSDKIAIAQSDNIVFIYKIGKEWGDKKSICNKFPTSSSVTTLVWPHGRQGEVVFGLAEGKVRAGLVRTNKSQVLYSTDSYVVSLSSSRDGESIVSGHLDGSIYAYHIESQATQKVITHHSIPYALGWGEQIVAAGNDAKVSFYDLNGNLLQRFDYTNDDKIKEFTLAAFNPAGDTVVLGNYNRFYIYNYNQRRGQWEEIGVKHIENYYTVTALGWKNDGSKLVTGSLCGSVDWYDASMKKINYKGKFELNYVSPSQIVVKSLQTGKKSVVRSNVAGEINKINIYQDKFSVANTHETIIVTDLEMDKSSEIPWRNDGKEKYDFSNPGVCMVYSGGELTLLEYGNNEPLGNCRTEHMKSNLISARLNYTGTKQTKMIAYLLDLQTIYIQDLSNNTTVAQILHDSKIDFIELNAHANKLLFRDKKRQLYLFNIKTQMKNTLLSYCSYAQWVPDSEVVVAQNRQNLCVWYSIENPDKVTIYNIKGDVESIERNQGKTEVIVNDGGNPVAYSLDESLIEFGFAIESGDLEKAATILDPLEMNADTEANWKTLAKFALSQQNIMVAEHCYAALGDICKAAYLRKTNKLIHDNKEGMENYKVQAKLAILDKQFHRAEAILLDHDEVEEAMEMYQELHKWDESIKIAEKKNHPQIKELKENYYMWLIQTKQEAKAAEVKESEGQLLKAIELYLQGNLPAKAAYIVFNYNTSFPQEVLENIAKALCSAGMYERAGEFYEQMEQNKKALEMYVNGNSYKKAIDLAKKVDARLVVQLEEKCGDWLVSQKQTENAVNHYIEAGCYQKAIEASINSRQWSKSIQLLQHQSPEVARPFYKQIAKHYADVRQYDFAEKYYLKAGLPVEAFEMYAKASKWDHALKVARENLPENEIVSLYVKQGQKFQQMNLLKEAEKLYCTVDEYDRAIDMYQKAEQYESVVRIVSKYRPKQLKDVHMQIAQRLQKSGNYKQAEHHYIEAGAWNVAVEMYQQNKSWEDAVRCCKLYGSDKETCELAKQWAELLGPDAGMKILLKYNLIDALIEYLCDRKEFEEAFKMTSKAIHKKPDVHLKYAFELEDTKRYKEAEEHFIKAGKPEEAINMYEHLGDFQAALQVAKVHQKQNIGNILMNQARGFIEKREYKKAENCFIQAKKPELAVKMYKDINNFQEAFRVAKKDAPHLVQELNQQFNQGSGGKQAGNQGPLSGEDLLRSAKVSEECRDYSKAIDSYLDVNSDNFDDQEIIEKVWNRAIQLAQNNVKERLTEVVKIVAKRLRDLGKYKNAANIYENYSMFKEAVACYVEAKNYNKAKECAQQVNNQELRNQMIEYIEQSEMQYLESEGKGEDVIQKGKIEQGLDMIIQKGDWKQALDRAANAGGEILSKYLRRYAKFTMEKGAFGETIEAYSQYGMQLIPENYKIYKTLALEIFVECDPKEINNLRTALYNFYRLLQGAKEENSAAGKQFIKYLTVAHLLNLKSLYEKKNMVKLHQKLTVCLLRYCDLVRIDKLFYEAGIACQKQNQLTYAFVILNRYLDIYEVIQDPDGNDMGDNSGFQLTDIPSPYDVPLPEKNIVDQSKIDQIRNWVLEISYNQKVEKDFPLRSCESCKTQIYECCITCPKCKSESDVCVLTGMPLLKGQSTNCRSCGKGGLKEFWNIYLQNFANCPWCNNPPN